jgi:hypothetical protein
VLSGTAVEESSLFRPRWFLHRRDEKTETKCSLEEARPEGERPKQFLTSSLYNSLWHNIGMKTIFLWI